MREVIIGGVKKISVRGMKRKEIRECADFGIGYSTFAIDPKRFDELCDKVLLYQFEEKELDDLENVEQLKLFNAVLAETYGAPGEEKNLSRSGPGDQTKQESNGAQNAESGPTN